MLQCSTLTFKCVRVKKLTSVQPDLHLLERVIDSVAEHDEPESGQNEQGIDFVGMAEATEHKSENDNAYCQR